MDKKFDDILNECMERLLINGEAIEQCLQDYPEQAAELEPLLRTALDARKAMDIQPSAEFKARARYQFRSALAEAASRKERPSFFRLPRWATVVTMVAGLLLIGSGTVAAAGYSMPDSPLYAVKLGTEQVQMTFTFSDTSKAELNAELADRRVTEMVYAANKGDAGQVQATAERLEGNLIALASLAGATDVEDASREQAPPYLQKSTVTDPSTKFGPGNDAAAGGAEEMLTRPEAGSGLKGTIAGYASDHPAALRAALENAPESSKAAIRQAIASLEENYQQVLEALD